MISKYNDIDLVMETNEILPPKTPLYKHKH